MLARLTVSTILLLSSGGSKACKMDTVDDLRDAYETVFTTRNRNAASHLWASHILKDSAECSADKIDTLFRGFCAVSGSVLPDSPQTQYAMTLPQINGGTVTGVARHCCWPCVCDMLAHVYVDTLSISTSEGSRERWVLVIGNPCEPEVEAALTTPYEDAWSGEEIRLQDRAPEIKCEGGQLRGATLSDHGLPVIGMFYDSAVPGSEPAKASDLASECAARQEAGYNSGMGKIFVQLASINPLHNRTFNRTQSNSTQSSDNSKLRAALSLGVVFALVHTL